MANTEKPGISFIDMLLLVLKNHRQPVPFTPQIMMAIFWEETLFTNRRQIGGGRGVGFGQVEKQLFFHLTQPEALALGYAVPGVNSNTTTLDDDRSVQVASCILLHWFHRSTATTVAGRKQFAYRAYGGVDQAQGTPLTAQQRLAIIRKWKECETALLELPFSEFTIINFMEPIQPLENRYLAALKKAKSFNENTIVKRLHNGKTENVTLRERLFPRYWFFPPADKLALENFLPAGTSLRQGSQGAQVQLLQKMLNAQPLPPSPLLTTNGNFASMTKRAVQAFQAQHGLAADGVVGAKTRAALI